MSESHKPNLAEHHVIATNPKRDWSYLSEGGATIVFSYVGSDPTFHGTVLRLRKSLRWNAVSTQHPFLGLHGVSSSDETDDPTIAFQNIVTSKLIPSKHLPRLQSVIVFPEWLQELAGAIEMDRPAERTVKGGIDISRCKAVLATDLVSGKGWAVEIKPKWGFLPSPTYLSPATRQFKMRHCRFCMHKHLKVIQQGLAGTNYCPLDFFSRDEARVRKALQSLWEAWLGSEGEGNNLRIFNEGKLVDPGDPHSLSRFKGTLLRSSQSSAASPDVLLSFTNAILPLILDNDLVCLLARLQRKLDSLDIEGLSKLWSSLHPGMPLGHGEPDPTFAEWEDFAHAYHAGGEETLRYKTLAYLLSATFKDCSVILRFHDSENTEDTITVIDLDPKSVNRLSKWEALDLEIVRHFAEVADGRVPCAEASTCA